ncbi:hypothetical protein [Streptomyces sp. NPDC008137]|uniref:hypothetical protein n=1 Tax=Streptomyces sp. NPDC008137 TaxID=3364813 RepID=UPI0036EE44AA
MTSSAAPSGAVARALRAAAGRRALQVALLVGGVLVLGLLCGERAYAADGVRVSADSAAGRLVGGQTLPARPDAHASADRVVRVVDDARKSVGGQLVKAQAKLPAPPKAPPLTNLPDLPDLPDSPVPPKAPSVPVLPGLPSLPDLPAVPDSPALPDLPGLPAPTAPPAPPDDDLTVPGVPAQPGLPGCPASPGHPLPATGPVTADPPPGDTPATPAPVPAPAGKAAPVAHGPHGDQAHAPYTDRAAHDHAAHDHAHHLRRAAHAGASASVGGAGPVGHVPGGRPDGTLCNRSMADHGSPRHGDAHAVTPSSPAPLSLLRGAAVRTCPAGIRDSHRDIPVFPG